MDYDRHGNPVCGQSFMAGTICTRPPGHDGGHAPYCQACKGDWYNGTCTCVGEWPVCLDCGSEMEAVEADMAYVYCGDCACPTSTVGLDGSTIYCYKPRDHDHGCIYIPPWRQPAEAGVVSEEDIAAAVESIVNDMPAIAFTMRTCVDCGQGILSKFGGDPPTCKTHN